MENNEGVIQALHEFENMTDADKVLTEELENVFVQIAHTGRIQIPWVYLKPVFMFKMDKVMREFFESSPSRNSNSTEPTHTAEFDVMRQRLLDCIDSFTSAPFTIQRLCELMIEPKRHYKSSDKFMRGIEKNVLVVSTMSDTDGEELANNIDGNHESTNIPNGPITNGMTTTVSSTEMDSIDNRGNNGECLQHFHETNYPTQEELPNHNGDECIGDKDVKDVIKTEISESREEVKELVQNSTEKEDHISENKDKDSQSTESNEEDTKPEEQVLVDKSGTEETNEEKLAVSEPELEEKSKSVKEEEDVIQNLQKEPKELVAEAKENESKLETETETAAATTEVEEPMEE